MMNKTANPISNPFVLIKSSVFRINDNNSHASLVGVRRSVSRIILSFYLYDKLVRALVGELAGDRSFHSEGASVFWSRKNLRVLSL